MKPMKKQDWIDYFVRFMYENNHAWSKFVEAYYAQHHEGNLQYKLSSSTPGSYISSAFGWMGTDEGENYWMNLSEKWESRTHIISVGKFKIKCKGCRNIWTDF